jgi:hypothetical protein
VIPSVMLMKAKKNAMATALGWPIDVSWTAWIMAAAP